MRRLCASAARIKVFDGTHPMFTQVPPNVPFSAIAARAPSSAPLLAAANPADPPPPITRSKSPSPREMGVIAPRSEPARMKSPIPSIVSVPSKRLM